MRFILIGVMAALFSLAGCDQVGGGTQDVPSPSSQTPLPELPERAVNVEAGPRVALVIGNGGYADGLALEKPPEDARSVAQALRAVGFEVTVKMDLNDNDTKRAIREHKDRITELGPETISFFYYAGHGAADRTISQGSANFIVPVGADIRSPSDLPIEAVNLGDIVNAFKQAKSSFLVFDACRNFPFNEANTRTVAKGFAKHVEDVQGTVIAFSTDPNKVAFDDSGYARALAREIQRSGNDHTDLFKNVATTVDLMTDGQQFPWYRDGINGYVYFAGEPEDGGLTAEDLIMADLPTTGSATGASRGSGQTDEVSVVTDGTTRTITGFDKLEKLKPGPSENRMCSVGGLAFSPTEIALVSGGSNNSLFLFKPDESEDGIELIGHGGCVLSFDWSDDGRHVVSGAADGSVIIWDMSTRTEVRRLAGNADAVFAVDFDPTGQRILTGAVDGSVHIYNAQTGSLETAIEDSLQNIGPVWAAKFDTTGERVAFTNTQAKGAFVWNVAAGALERAVLTGNKAPTAISWTSDGNWLITNAHEPVLRLNSLRDDIQSQTIATTGNGGRSAALDPQGRYVATGAWDGTVRIYDIETGAIALELSGYTDDVSGVAWESTGNIIATADDTGALQFWRVDYE